MRYKTEADDEETLLAGECSQFHLNGSETLHAERGHVLLFVGCYSSFSTDLSDL